MTTSSRKVFLDTNLLIRANIEEAPLHKEALTAIDDLWNLGAELWISGQVIREYISVRTRPQSFANPQPVKLIAERVRFFQAVFRVAEDNAAVTSTLLNLVEAIPMGGRQVHDANIVATMLVHGISELLTHNIEDFKRFSAHISLVPLEAT